MANKFFYKIKLIPAWISEFFHFCPLQRRKKTDDSLFLIIGHRGSPSKEIENTLDSFETAIREGANALEVDLSMTKDGVVVCWHDWDPNDTTSILRESGFEPFVKYKPHPPALGSDLRRKINTLNLDEFLGNFDYKLINGDNTESAGAKIPTLREFFEWSRKYKNLLYVFFDIKCPENECDLSLTILDKIQELMDEFKPGFKVIMETASLAVFKTMRQNLNGFDCCLDIEPPLGIILDPSEYSSVMAAIKYKNKYAISLRPRKITVANWTTFRRIIRFDVKLRKKHNREDRSNPVQSIICATVSKPNELRCLVKMGVGGIQTDYPDKLRRIASKYKKRLQEHEQKESLISF